MQTTMSTYELRSLHSYLGHLLKADFGNCKAFGDGEWSRRNVESLREDIEREIHDRLKHKKIGGSK